MKVKVNDVELDLPQNTSAIDAVFAAGYDVPYFCSHEYMSPIGACRMCLAKVGAPRKDRVTGEWILDEETKEPKIFWFPNPMATCTTAVMEGMVIDTLCNEAKKAQAGMVELHLINHPLDCPTCDKGGACELQDRAYEYGDGLSRFVFDKRHQEKHHSLSDLVTLDRERCIHCKRCVRYFEEVPGDEVLDFIERGGHTYIGNIEQGLPSNFSGNITDICPVGALLDASARFRGRNWEYSHTHSISMNDASGAAIIIDSRTGRIERVKADLNTQINKVWIDDGSRFGHEYANSEEQVKTPLIRKGDKLMSATWTEAATYIKENLAKFSGSEIGLILKADSTLEEAIAARSLAKHLDSEQLEHYPRPPTSVIPQGQQATYNDVATSDAIFVIADLTEELPILDLRIKDALKGVSPPELMAHGIPIADLRLQEHMQLKKEILTVAAPYQVDLMKYAGRSLNYKVGKEAEFFDNLPKELIEQLQKAQNAVVILGGFILAHPEASSKLYALAAKVGAKVMSIGPMANSYGLDAMGLTNGDYQHMIHGGAKALIISGLNPAQETKALEEVEFLVVHSSFLNLTTGQADVVLPAKTSLEKQGTVRNVEGRYLKVSPAPINCGESEDFMGVVKHLGKAWDQELVGHNLLSAWQAFTKEFGINLQELEQEGYLPELTAEPLSKLQGSALEGNVLLSPSMVKPEYNYYNTHLQKAFGKPALHLHPNNALSHKLSANDKVSIQVSGFRRFAIVKISEKVPEDLMLLPALPEQPSGLYTLESIEVVETMQKLEVA